MTNSARGCDASATSRPLRLIPTAKRRREQSGKPSKGNREKIQRWLEREGGHPNLVLDYDSDHPVGRTIRRGEEQAEPCSHALVVLKWDGERQYHVLTSYPEC